MRKIYYNLAGTRKINVRAFALIVTIIFLAVVLLNWLSMLNLARQQRQSRAEKSFLKTKLLEDNIIY